MIFTTQNFDWERLRRKSQNKIKLIALMENITIAKFFSTLFLKKTEIYLYNNFLLKEIRLIFAKLNFNLSKLDINLLPFFFLRLYFLYFYTLIIDILYFLYVRFDIVLSGKLLHKILWYKWK